MNKKTAALTLEDIVCLSGKRRAILLLLGKKGYGIEELTEVMNMTSHSLAPQLKTLKDERIVSIKNGIYELTEVGHILVKNMYPLFETMDVLEKNQRYWFDRNMAVIPSKLAEQIREIGNYQLLEYDISEYMFDVPAEFSENLKKSNFAFCLLSFYHPIYSRMQFEMAETGKKMVIIVTRKVHERLIEEEKDRLGKLIKQENVKYMIYNGDCTLICPTMTLTDVFSYIYFFNNDGVYDNKIILSTDDRTLAWSKELYEHYKKQSVYVKAI